MILITNFDFQHEIIIINYKQFNNGEIDLELDEDKVKGKNVIILQSIINHNDIIKLLFLAKKCKTFGVKHITAFTPYLSYTRHDNIKNESNLSAMISSFKAVKIDKIITIDIHSLWAKKIISEILPIESIDIIEVFAADILKQKLNLQQHVIISPDEGSITRASKLGKVLNVPVFSMEKIRGKFSKIIGKHNIIKKNAIIIDDIIDSGDTLMNAIDCLQKNGISSTISYVTHPVLSKKIVQEKIVITNTIQHKNLPDNYRIIDINVPDIIKKIIK